MTNPSQEDRRSFPRAEVLLAGSMRGQIEKCDCAVLDISLSGAKLKLDAPLKAANIETLNLSTTSKLRVSLAWSHDTVIGVTFLDDPHDIAVALEGLLPEECFGPYKEI